MGEEFISPKQSSSGEKKDHRNENSSLSQSAAQDANKTKNAAAARGHCGVMMVV
jgi:hypothetical protein